MIAKVHQQLNRRKRRIERRLDPTKLGDCAQPMFTAGNIHYEIGDRCHGLAHGGIGVLHTLARKFGLIDAINDRLHLLVVHLPYHESDHVLNLAYNALCGGTCLEDLELRRHDEVYLDALGTRRIPDPTTAGDFCRRFTPDDIQTLLDVYHDTRLRIWAQQPDSFFEQACLDMDGTLVGTTGQCKQDMDIAHDGTWGYHPLVLSLANTGEVLSLVNRPASRPSHEGAAEQVDRCLDVCFRGGFRQVLLRGDTDFSQTEHLDRWNADPRVEFIFGYDATPNLKALADDLPADAWQPLERAPRYTVQTEVRGRRDNVKEAVVVAREFENQRLVSEDVAEFDYRPTACRETYRMVVVRKNLSVEKGEHWLFDDIRYFFYINNRRPRTRQDVVFTANDRCNQENVLAQLHGLRALHAPVDNLVSNWAYMVMVALAWNLKAWWALSLPEQPGRWQARHRAEKQSVLRMEFKTFVAAFVRIPCQIIRTGRQWVYRLLAWNPQQRIFWRLVSALRC